MQRQTADGEERRQKREKMSTRSLRCIGCETTVLYPHFELSPVHT